MGLAQKQATWSLMKGAAENRTEAAPIFGNLITKDELAQHLSLSLSLLNKLMAEEGLPHFKFGRAVRFRLNDVYAWSERKGYKL